MPVQYVSGGEYEVSCSRCGTRLSTYAPGDSSTTDPRTGQALNDVFSFSSRRNTWRSTCRSCARQTRSSQPRSRRVAGGTVLGLGRTFGVELELIFPARMQRTTIAAALTDAGLTGWRVKGDGSLSGGNGMEVVSPVLSGENGIEQVRTACRVLNALGAKPNRSCGLHVHHGARDLDMAAMKRLAQTWKANQGTIDGLVSPSRRGVASSYYCRPLSDSDLAGILAMRETRSLSRLDRYRSLNLASYGRHGTVEVRQHQGTADAEKVISWIRFGQAIIDTAKAEGAIAPSTSVRGLFDRLGDRFDETARTFLTGRAVEFGAVTV
jgi:Putative amidoligase enzyme